MDWECDKGQMGGKGERREGKMLFGCEKIKLIKKEMAKNPKLDHMNTINTNGVPRSMN